MSGKVGKIEKKVLLLLGVAFVLIYCFFAGHNNLFLISLTAVFPVFLFYLVAFEKLPPVLKSFDKKLVIGKGGKNNIAKKILCDALIVIIVAVLLAALKNIKGDYVECAMSRFGAFGHANANFLRTVGCFITLRYQEFIGVGVLKFMCYIVCVGFIIRGLSNMIVEKYSNSKKDRLPASINRMRVIWQYIRPMFVGFVVFFVLYILFGMFKLEPSSRVACPADWGPNSFAAACRRGIALARKYFFVLEYTPIIWGVLTGIVLRLRQEKK